MNSPPGVFCCPYTLTFNVLNSIIYILVLNLSSKRINYLIRDHSENITGGGGFSIFAGKISNKLGQVRRGLNKWLDIDQAKTIQMIKSM